MPFCDDLVLPTTDALLINLDKDELLILFLFVLLRAAQSSGQ